MVFMFPLNDMLVNHSIMGFLYFFISNNHKYKYKYPLIYIDWKLEGIESEKSLMIRVSLMISSTAYFAFCKGFWKCGVRIYGIIVILGTVVCFGMGIIVIFDDLKRTEQILVPIVILYLVLRVLLSIQIIPVIGVIMGLPLLPFVYPIVALFKINLKSKDLTSNHQPLKHWMFLPFQYNKSIV